MIRAIAASPTASGWTGTSWVLPSIGSTQRVPDGLQASWPPDYAATSTTIVPVSFAARRTASLRVSWMLLT